MKGVTEMFNMFIKKNYETDKMSLFSAWLSAPKSKFYFGADS